MPSPMAHSNELQLVAIKKIPTIKPIIVNPTAMLKIISKIRERMVNIALASL